METIAVIFGGQSAEHDISIITALGSIIKPLELTKKYRVEAVYVAKDGTWYWDEKLKDINLFTSGQIKDLLHRSSPASVQFDGGMTLVKASGIAGRKQHRKVDIAFPAMHGTYGEDGALMGLLDMVNIPYVGCGVDASAVAMDKVLAKKIAMASNIQTSKFLTITRTQLERHPKNVSQEVQKDLLFPLFVKPARLGSSIGISKATNENELLNGLEVAVHYDDKVIVEEAVQNLVEVTLPIIGNMDPIPGYLEQPLVSAEDFFDFDTKYLGNGKKMGCKRSGIKGSQGYSKIPADLPKTLYDKAEKTGLAIYKALGCSGIARVDMLIDIKTGIVYFNEVNPMPGSLYVHNWRQKGLSNVDLVQKLIVFAKERHTDRTNLTTTFTTSFLQQF